MTDGDYQRLKAGDPIFAHVYHWKIGANQPHLMYAEVTGWSGRCPDRPEVYVPRLGMVIYPPASEVHRCADDAQQCRFCSVAGTPGAKELGR
jgi:hypothetical protein